HGGVLASELREGAVRAARARGQVAGAADLVGFFAIHDVALEVQGFHLFALLGVPDVVLAFNASRLGGRGAGKGDAGGQERGEQNGDFHDGVLFGYVAERGTFRRRVSHCRLPERRAIAVRSGRRGAYLRLSSHIEMALISSSLTRCITPFMAAVWPLLRAPLLMSFICCSA